MNSFFVTKKIGDTRYLTPDGFLLCRNVPIARTGELDYRDYEVAPLEGVDGKVTLTRRDDALFSPETIASFQAKPILDGFHKTVTPENYRDITVGTVTNVRRGGGALEDFLLGDLLIMDQQAIDRIQSGDVKEVSIGFNADYDQTAPGRGIQKNIRGNHVAIVPTSEGRAGSCCALGDSVTENSNREDGGKMADLQGAATENQPTSDNVNLGVLKGLAELFGWGKKNGGEGDVSMAGDQNGGMEERLAAVEAALAKLLPGEQSDTMPDSFGDRLTAIEDALGELLHTVQGGEFKGEVKQSTAAAQGEDDAGETLSGDQEPEDMEEGEVVAGAEVIAPGEEPEPGDSIGSFVITSLIKGAAVNPTVKNIVTASLGKGKPVSDVARLKKPVINAIFRSAVTAVKEQNTAISTGTLSRLSFADSKKSAYKAPMTGRDLQDIVDQRYGRKPTTLV